MFNTSVSLREFFHVLWNLKALLKFNRRLKPSCIQWMSFSFLKMAIFFLKITICFCDKLVLRILPCIDFDHGNISQLSLISKINICMFQYHILVLKFLLWWSIFTHYFWFHDLIYFKSSCHLLLFPYCFKYWRNRITQITWNSSFFVLLKEIYLFRLS